jgi:hypothetical protein
VVLDLQVKVAHGDDVAEPFGHLFNCDSSHPAPPDSLAAHRAERHAA